MSEGYYSQELEDKWIVENLRPTISGFAEIGASNGLLGSNTLHFENAGWSGILVEAQPDQAWQCSNNRKSPTVCCAIGRAGIRPFHINLQEGGLSGLEAKGHKTIPVAVIPLEPILNLVPVPVHLLSIDTEGTELEVWSTRGSHRPRIVIMEYNTCGVVQDAALVNQMNKDGYREVHRTVCNIIFIPKP